MKRHGYLKDKPEKSWVMWAVWSAQYSRWWPVGLPESPMLYQTRAKARKQMSGLKGEMVVKVICRPVF